MKPLILPQINLNGTSREVLVEQQVTILENLRQTIHAMVEASPNGRDYQLRPDEYRAARDAWYDRCSMMSTLLNEIEQHAIAIQDSN